jgi:hypothetical protein
MKSDGAICQWILQLRALPPHLSPEATRLRRDEIQGPWMSTWSLL